MTISAKTTVRSLEKTKIARSLKMEEKNIETKTETDNKAGFVKQEDYDNLKQQLDKLSSEIAERKRKERERLSNEEKQKAEIEEKEAHYKDIEKKLALREFSDELDDISDSKTKQKISEAFANGEILEALKLFKTWRNSNKVELEKEIKQRLMQDNPDSTPQGEAPLMTKEKIMSITDTAERQAEIAKHIDLFA